MTPIDTDALIDSMCQAYNVKVHDMARGYRGRPTAHARRAIASALRDSGMSYNAISRVEGLGFGCPTSVRDAILKHRGLALRPSRYSSTSSSSS